MRELLAATNRTDFTQELLVAALAAIALVILLILLRTRQPGQADPSDAAGRRTPPEADEPTAPVARKSPSDSLSDTDVDTLDFVSSSTPALDRSADRIPAVDECRNAEAIDLVEAGRLWRRRADLLNALRCFEAGGAHLDAARIYRAIGRLVPAVARMNEALKASPLDELIRLELVELYLDLGQADEARKVVQAVDGKVSDLRASARLFEEFGRCFEAAGLEGDALSNYRAALEQNDALASVLIQVRYLEELSRLRARVKSAGGQFGSEAAPRDPVLSPSMDEIAVAELPIRYKTVVGHVAMGGVFEVDRPISVRSTTNRAIRFGLDRVLSTSDTHAAFAASDRILDIPVMLRAYAIQGEIKSSLPIVEQRLRSVGKLNHPNLAKLDYADRDEYVLRLVYEYLPGGNVGDFLNKLPSVGLPLLVRLGLQVIYGIEAAHKQGIAHGDLRVENILVGTDQRLKVTDFDLLSKPAASEDDTDSQGLNIGSTTADPLHADLVQFGALMMELVARAKKRGVAPPPPGVVMAGEFGDELRILGEQIASREVDTATKVRGALEQILEKAVGMVSSSRRRA